MNREQKSRKTFMTSRSAADGAPGSTVAARLRRRETPELCIAEMSPLTQLKTSGFPAPVTGKALVR